MGKKEKKITATLDWPCLNFQMPKLFQAPLTKGGQTAIVCAAENLLISTAKDTKLNTTPNLSNTDSSGRIKVKYELVSVHNDTLFL